MTEIQATIMVLRVIVVFLIALFCLLCIHFPRIEFFRWWTAAWAVFGVHLACGAMLEASGSSVWRVAQLLAGYIQSPLLAIGGRRYHVPEYRTSRRTASLAIYGAAIAGLLFYWFSTAETEPYAAVIRDIPRKALLGCALGYCTWVCVRRALATRSWSASANAAAFAISALSELGTSIDWVCSVYQIPLPEFLFQITRTTARHQLTLGLTWSFGASLGMILLLLEEHRRTERAEEENRRGRQELERNFAKAVRAGLDPITISDLETGRYVEANEAFFSLTGYTREEVIGRTSLELGIWELPQERETFASLLREEGAVQNYELRVRKRDGTTAFLIASADLLDVHGRPHVLSMSKDITDRKQAEEELRRSEAKFRQLADSMPQIVWNAGPTGEILYYNRGWPEYTGLSGNESRDAAWRKALHPDEASRWQSGWQAAVESGEPFEMEHRLRSAVGRFEWFLTRAVPARDNTGIIVRWFATSTKIDEQKRTEEILRHVNEDLRQFAYIASHTLQEPVKNVSVFAEMLSRHHADRLNEEGRDCVQTVMESARHIRSLVRDLLEYTRAGELGRASSEVTDTNAVVSEVLYSLQASIQECGAVIVSDGLTALPASRVHLRQLFQNLIENAIKYRGEPPPRIEIRTEHINDQWRTSISDNGIGIERQYWDQIFRLFRRLHGDEHPGTGIGLALCRKIVETYGGKIWVESAPGRGSTFVFTLPDRHGETGSVAGTGR